MAGRVERPGEERYLVYCDWDFGLAQRIDES
jgi:hypothetical protein